MGRRANGQADGRIDGGRDGWEDGWMGRGLGEWMGGWAGGWMDRWASKQTSEVGLKLGPLALFFPLETRRLATSTGSRHQHEVCGPQLGQTRADRPAHSYLLCPAEGLAHRRLTLLILNWHHC